MALFSKAKHLIAAASLIAVSATTSAGQSSQHGVVFDHTSIPGALLIRFDPAVTPLPDNCAGAATNWMMVPEAKKTILAVAMMAIAMNNRTMTEYTSGINGYGYCEINQIDPAG